MLRPEEQEGPVPGEALDLGPALAARGAASLGRRRDADVVLREEAPPMVSRVHAVVRRGADGRHWLVAANTVHPTLLNGAPLPRCQAAELRPGDRIGLGTYQFRWEPPRFEGGPCPACLEGEVPLVPAGPCGHGMCAPCLRTWRGGGPGRACPLCRAPLAPDTSGASDLPPPPHRAPPRWRVGYADPDRGLRCFTCGGALGQAGLFVSRGAPWGDTRHHPECATPEREDAVEGWAELRKEDLRRLLRLMARPRA